MPPGAVSRSRRPALCECASNGEVESVAGDFPWLAVLVLLVAIGLGVAGQFALKIGLNKLGVHPSPAAVFRAIITPYILGGFALYGLSSLLYLQALSRLPLSYAYPMIALSYVAVVLGAWLWFGEKLNALRIGGVAAIILGVVLVAVSYAGASPVSPSPR